MTQILTALTPRHIVQASDRRVVWIDEHGKVMRQQDGYIKAVITQAFSCSYTGIADLGAGDTAEWLAITLSDYVNDADGGIRALATTAQQAVNTSYFRDRALTIVTRAGRNKEVRSFLCLPPLTNLPPANWLRWK